MHIMADQRPTTGRPEPGDFDHRCIPTWPHIPRKFTRPSHLGCVAAPNRLFLGSGSASRVGSIPIARSIFRWLTLAYVVRPRTRELDRMSLPCCAHRHVVVK